MRMLNQKKLHLITNKIRIKPGYLPREKILNIYTIAQLFRVILLFLPALRHSTNCSHIEICCFRYIPLMYCLLTSMLELCYKKIFSGLSINISHDICFAINRFCNCNTNCLANQFLFYSCTVCYLHFCPSILQN